MEWNFSGGLLDLGVWGLVVWTIGVTQMTILTVTIYLHRYAAHRALELSKPLQHIFRFWSWLTTGMKTSEWVGVHRVHHAKCELPEDPHSPVQKGLWRILFFGVYYYVVASDREEVRRAAHDAPRDWIERNLYSRLPGLGVALLFVANIWLHGASGILVFLVQVAWIPFWAAGVINGVGHAVVPTLARWRLLYQNYRNGDPVPEEYARSDDEVFTNVYNSCNILPLGLWIGGEELHGNHHAFPTSPKFSRKWYEVDIGWAVICVLQLLGQAKLKRNFR
jgi:stearoyl-CoA desaturase (Delta-9 desaturase)